MRNPRSRRTLVTIAGLVAASTVLTSCGFSSGSGGTNNGADLRVVWWGDDTRAQATQAALAFIEESNSGYTLTGEGSSYDGYFEKLATQFAGGTAPDIIQFNVGASLLQFGSEGVLLPLDEFLGDQLDVSEYEEFLEYGRIDGVTYGIPLSQTTFAAIYRPEQFEAWGVDAPSSNWDWDDFERLCKEVVAASGGVACSVDPSMEQVNYEMWHYGKTGKNLYDAEGARQDSPELLEEWFQMWADYRADGLIVSPDVQVVHRLGDTATSPLVTGAAAIAFDYSTTFPSYAPLLGSVPSLATVPASGSYPNAYISPTSMWSVNAETSNPEAAIVVVDALINDPEVLDMLGMTRGVPISSVALDIVSPTLDEAQSKLVEFLDQARQGELRPLSVDLPTAAAEIDSLFRRVGEEVAFATVSPAEGAKSFFDQASALLK
jgi:multiple sugar transport system substrate-binding protein